MSITIKIPRLQVTRLKQIIRLQLSLKWMLIISFILAFFARLMPELCFPVPVGFDTALYLAGAKYNPNPKFGFRILQRFILPYMYHVLKIDLLTFMKIYAPIIHALTTMLLVLYAAKVLSWSRAQLFTLMLLLSLTPAILRMTWDTHSQNLATLMLAGILAVMGRKLNLLRFLIILPILALITLTHQLVTVIVFAILFVEVLYSLKGSDRKKIASMILIFVGCLFIAIYINPVLTPSKALTKMQVMLISPKNTTITPTMLAIQGLAVTWYIAPVAIIGAFKERRLLTWALTSVTIFLLGFLVTNPNLLVPGRWITYASFPLAFFAANSAATNKRNISWRNISSIIFIVLTLLTGIGMLFPTGIPITSLMHKAYPEIPETLASSTAKKEHIEAIIDFTNYLNSVREKDCLITHYPWFFWWAQYFYNGKTLYNGPAHTTEQTLKTFVEKNISSCNKIHIIWFTGLTWAKEIRRVNELALYEYEKKTI